MSSSATVVHSALSPLQGSNAGQTDGLADVYEMSASEYESARKKRRVGFRSNSSSSNTASASESVSSLQAKKPPVLYTDAVHSILVFLHLSELSVVHRLNHQWKERVNSLKPRSNRSFEIDCKKWKLFAKSGKSPLCYHVSKVKIGAWSDISFQAQCLRLQRFPCLHSITGMRITKEYRKSAKLLLPPNLTSLHIHCYSWSLQLTIDGVGKLMRLKKLYLKCFGKTHSANLSFDPLIHLQALEVLSFSLDEPQDRVLNTVVIDPRSRKLIETVRQMPQLRRLNIDRENFCVEEKLGLLTQTPHQLQGLQCIAADFLSNDEFLLVKANFPNLTTLFVEYEGLPFDFQQVPKVTKLVISRSRLDVDNGNCNLPTSLIHLPVLQDLTLSGDLTGDELSAVVRALPNLCSLKLRCMSKLNHLKALESGAITRTLTYLEIIDCQGINSTELARLQNLCALRSLKIDDGGGHGNHVIFGIALMLFAPGSSVRMIKSLESFCYNDQVIVSRDGVIISDSVIKTDQDLIEQTESDW